MNKNVGIAATVGIVIVITAITFQIYEPFNERSTIEEYYEDKSHNDDTNIKSVVYPENQQVLYGLIITKDKYLLGENVFMRVNNIPMQLIDSIQFYTPNNVLYLSLPFDGTEKSSFKHYFRPSLLKQLDLCDKEDLIGEWTVKFASLPSDELHFQVMNEILPHSEKYYETCSTESIQFPQIEPSLNQDD